MKKNSKIIALSIVLAFGLNFAITQNAMSSTLSKIENTSVFTKYQYSISDNLYVLKTAKNDINRNLKSYRWKDVPENLLMVYFWNKENYNDDSLSIFADEWLNLSKQAIEKYNLNEAILSSVFAYLIKQNYFQAEQMLKTLCFDENTKFLGNIAKTLIGYSEKATGYINKNQQYSFTYSIRIIDFENSKKALELRPNSAIARYTYLLAMQMDQKRKQKTEESEDLLEDTEGYNKDILDEINKIIELDPNNFLYQLKKLSITYDKDKTNQIDDEIEKLLNKSSQNTYVAEIIGNIHARNKSIDKAIEYTKIALEKDDSRTNLYKKLGQLYSYKDDLKPMINILENGVEKYPNELDFYNGLAEIYDREGIEQEKIIKLFEKGIKFNPNNSSFYVSLGDAYYNSKNEDKAIEEYLKSIEIDKNTEGYGKLISIYWDKKDNDKIIEISEKLIKDKQDFVLSYLWLGAAYIDKKEVEKGINSIKKAIEIDPKFIPAYNSLGIAYRAGKEFDKAIIEFNKAIKLDSNYLDAIINLGDTYYQQKQYKEALETYQKGLELDQYNKDIHFLVGNVYSDMQEYPKAEESLQKSILMDSNFLDARNNLGNIYLKQKKIDNALSEFQAIIKIDKNYATAYYNIACSYSLLNKKEKSLEFLKQSILLNKEFKELAKTDVDFDNIKNDKEFKNLTGE